MPRHRKAAAATGLVQPESDAAQKFRSPIEYRHRPGYTRRNHRVASRFQWWREHVRHEQPQLDAAGVDAEATRRLRQELFEEHQHAPKWYERTAPTSRCPDRSRIFNHVEAAAIRDLPQARELAAILRAPTRGRPTDRRHATALFERCIYGEDRKELKALHHEFLTDNALLHWAYEQPLQANGGDSLEAAYRTLPAALDRHDPEQAVRLNLEAIRVLAELGHDEIGRFLAVDGVAVEGHFEQRGSVNDIEERLLSRGTGADFKSHSSDDRWGKSWRGWNCVVLADLKSTLPLAWSLVPASVNESLVLPGLLDLLFEYWPACPAEFIVGDKAYDGIPLALELESAYAIHPVFPLPRTKVSPEYAYAASEGVPACARHGLMKLVETDDFLKPGDRLTGRLVPGVRSDSLLKARLRWKCPDCGVRDTTYVRNNARIHTFIPRRGEHHLVGLRIALMHRRNTVESVIGNLEEKGFALKGHWRAKWISSDDQMRWLIGGGLLAQTLRRLAHASGQYEQKFEDACRRKLVFAARP